MTTKSGRSQQQNTIIRPEARKRDPLPRQEIEIRPPKRTANPPTKPSIANIATMLATPLVVGVFLSFSGSNIFVSLLVMFTGLIGVGAQYWGYRLALKKHEKEEAERANGYRDYLRDKEDEVGNAAKRQQQIMWHENPSSTEMLKRVESRSRSLWQRLPHDNDFLTLRIGSSNLPATTTVTAFRQTESDDPLLEEANRLREKYKLVPNLPLTTNLHTLGVIGVRAQGRDVSLQIVFNLITHLVTHHSPDVLQLYIISHRPDAAKVWQWARWLPHLNLIQGQTAVTPRLSFAPETDDALLSPLAERFRRRLDRQRRMTQMGPVEPHIVIIFDPYHQLPRHKVVQTLLTNKPTGQGDNPLRASAIFMDHLPPQINALIEVQGTTLEYRETWTADANQTIRTGEAEMTSDTRIEQLARAMSPLRTDMQDQALGGRLPSNVRLVELLGATRPDNIDLDQHYSDRYQPLKVMSFPIGLNADLKPQMIQLREDSRNGLGHHALLAGTTGYGKSVTLQTIVLSLVAHNPPTHLNIVLADFRAGGELARLKGLPHVVGYVDDLDSAYVERFRLALEGEVRRREQLLNKTEEEFGRHIPNIYEYNLAGPEACLPHLVIIIDEFAKALEINPEFRTTIDKHIAAQGRALGIHLVLSTQKADDFSAVRPNIEVRMSMYLNSAEESRAIFKRDEAHRKLSRAGQAFLQVGDNRIFEMFQVARTDVPYTPEGTSSINLQDDFAIRQLSANGRFHTIYQHRSTDTDVDDLPDSTLSEAEVLVKHIRQYCAEKYPAPRIICLPPLPSAAQLPLFTLLDEAQLFNRWRPEAGWQSDERQPSLRVKVPLGLLDRPVSQEQDPFYLDLGARDGNFVVIGPSGSGKRMTLRSLVLALAASHSPDDLLFYFLSRLPALSLFENLPHCQAFIRLAESERVNRLFAFLAQESDRRRDLLGTHHVDDMAALRKVRPDSPLPSLVVILDDFASFADDRYERQQLLGNLAHAARQVDLHFILSMTGFNSLHGTLQRQLQNRLALGGTNTTELFEKRGQLLVDTPGRGFVIAEQALTECQIAAPTRRSDLAPGSQGRRNEMRQIVKMMQSQWTWPGGQRPLPAITKLAPYISLADLWPRTAPQQSSFNPHTAPIGLNYDHKPVALDISDLDTYQLIVGPPGSGKTALLLTIALAAANYLGPKQLDLCIIALQNKSILRLLRDLPQVTMAHTPTTAAKLLFDLQPRLQERAAAHQTQMEHPTIKTAETLKLAPPHTLILIDDWQLFGRNSDLNRALDQCLDAGDHSRLFLADTSGKIGQMRQHEFSANYPRLAYQSGSGFTFSLEQADMILLQMGGKLPQADLKQLAPTMGQGRCIWLHQGQLTTLQVGHVGEEGADAATQRAAVRKLVREINQRYQEGTLTATPDAAVLNEITAVLNYQESKEEEE